MIIIKRGIPPSEKPYDATCRCCQTEFRFLQDEGKLTFDQRDGNYITVACPVCLKPVHVSVK